MTAVNGLGSPRRSAVLLPLVLVMLMVSGCGLAETLRGETDDDANLADKIGVEYDRLGGSGSIDQALTITNQADVAVALKANIEPLDASGQVLESVKVRSLYGSTRGAQILVPGVSVDFLIFRGSRSSKVRDVRLADVGVETTEFPTVSTLVEAVPLDRAGRELDYPANFSTVALRNLNPEQVTVRVVGIVWNQPAQGESQQALKVLPLSELVAVPAGGEVRVAVRREDKRTIAEFASTNALSLKAYFSE